MATSVFGCSSARSARKRFTVIIKANSLSQLHTRNKWSTLSSPLFLTFFFVVVFHQRIFNRERVQALSCTWINVECPVSVLVDCCLFSPALKCVLSPPQHGWGIWMGELFSAFGTLCRAASREWGGFLSVAHSRWNLWCEKGPSICILLSFFFTQTNMRGIHDDDQQQFSSLYTVVKRGKKLSTIHPQKKRKPPTTSIWLGSARVDLFESYSRLFVELGERNEM